MPCICNCIIALLHPNATCCNATEAERYAGAGLPPPGNNTSYQVHYGAVSALGHNPGAHLPLTYKAFTGNLPQTARQAANSFASTSASVSPAQVGNSLPCFLLGKQRLKQPCWRTLLCHACGQSLLSGLLHDMLAKVQAFCMHGCRPSGQTTQKATSIGHTCLQHQHLVVYIPAAIRAEACTVLRGAPVFSMAISLRQACNLAGTSIRARWSSLSGGGWHPRPGYLSPAPSWLLNHPCPMLPAPAVPILAFPGQPWAGQAGTLPGHESRGNAAGAVLGPGGLQLVRYMYPVCFGCLLSSAAWYEYP